MLRLTSPEVVSTALKEPQQAQNNGTTSVQRWFNVKTLYHIELTIVSTLCVRWIGLLLTETALRWSLSHTRTEKSHSLSQSDLVLGLLFWESLNTLEWTDEQRRPWSACQYTQDDQTSYMYKGHFLRLQIKWSPQSDQREFVVRRKKLCIHGYPECAKGRFWSACANAQADLNLRWAHMTESTFSDVPDRIICNTSDCVMNGKR